MWFDFTTKGKAAYINSDAMLCITEMADGKTEIALAGGGGVIVDQPIDEVIGVMFDKVDEEQTDGE